MTDIEYEKKKNEREKRLDSFDKPEFRNAYYLILEDSRYFGLTAVETLKRLKVNREDFFSSLTKFQLLEIQKAACFFRHGKLNSGNKMSALFSEPDNFILRIAKKCDFLSQNKSIYFVNKLDFKKSLRTIKDE
jgi:hypothetical protein